MIPCYVSDILMETAEKWRPDPSQYDKIRQDLPVHDTDFVLAAAQTLEGIVSQLRVLPRAAAS